MATLGDDAGGRIAQRVEHAVYQPAGSHCAVVNASGNCAQCGSPVHAHRAGQGHGGVVVKQVLGNTLIEKQTCSTAIGFWRWQSLRWPKFVPRQMALLPAEVGHEHEHGDDHDHAHGPDEWKTLTPSRPVGCGLLCRTGGSDRRTFLGMPWSVTLALLGRVLRARCLGSRGGNLGKRSAPGR